MNNFKKYILLTLIFISPFKLLAQSIPLPVVGIETAHLLDLFEGDTKLANGYTDIDLKGMDGPNSQFDLGYGLKMEIPIKLKSSITVNIMNGRMTSERENQYAKIDLRMMGISYRQYFGSRRYLLKRDNPNRFKGRPFCQFGIGTIVYRGKRFFIKDNGLFSSVAGNSINTSTALGYSFEFGKHFQVVTTTDFILILSDAVDGYNNDKKSDILQKTGVSLMYRFN